MTICNLPIPPDDPRRHPFKKLESRNQPTLQQPYKTVPTSHRRVFPQHHRTGHCVDASHFHYPLSPYQSGHSESYLASLIDHDSLQPDICTLYIFEQFVLYIYRAVYNCIWYRYYPQLYTVYDFILLQ